MEKSKELLEQIIKSIATEPDKVSIETKTDEMGVLFTINLAKCDMGLLIGRAGSTIDAIRVIMKVMGIREKARINIKIAEPDNDKFMSNPRGSFMDDDDLKI